MLLEDMTEVSDTGVAAYRSRDPTMVWRVIRRCTETEKPPTVEVPDAEMLPTVDMDGFSTETEKPPTVEVPDTEMLPTVDMDGFKKAAINFKEVSKEFFEVVDRDALTSVVWDRLASSAD